MFLFASVPPRLEAIDMSHVPYRRFFSLVCTDVLDIFTLSRVHLRTEKESQRKGV